MTQSTGPIPRPLAHRWRDLRLRLAPVVVYVVAVGLVGWLWNRHWTPSAFSGEVQAEIANVASPQDGQLSELSVAQFDRVSKGQVIGRVTLSPAASSSALAAIRAELMVLRSRMAMDGQRNRLSYERVRADQLDQKVNLAIARSRLRFAENEVRRQAALQEEQIVSEFEYEAALDERDTLLAEVNERRAAVEALGQTVEALKPSRPDGAHDQALNAIDESIRAEEDRFRFASESLLRAPINGVVTKVYRLAGENVSNGEPLVVISSDRADSIIGFIREPGSVELRPGDVVTVRSRRGNQRLAAEANVVAVGARMELFTRPLRVRGLGNAQERGLPVLIDVPEELTLYPGELVDLTLKN